MDTQRVARLQQEVARALLDAAPRGWERLEEELIIVGGYGVDHTWALVAGTRERIPADMAGIHGMDLQKAMYEPGKGTWFSMECTVEPSREFHFSFNYDEPVEFDEHEEILDSSWVREFKRHPRPWVLIPDWNYVKQAFTEAEWAEQVAEFERTGRHTDS